MPANSADDAVRRRSLIALVVMMGVNTLIYSLSYPLFALVLDQRGVTAELIGYTTAAQAAAVFAVAPLVPRLIAQLGPLVVVLGSLVATAALFLLLPELESVVGWGVARFALGAVETTLWVAGESWVNQLAAPANRGRTMAAYTMSLSAGFALGPLLLAVLGSEGRAPFVTGAVMVGVAALPLFFVRNAPDEMRGRDTGSMLDVLRRAPVPMFTNLVFAATSGVLMTFFPLYALGLGLDQRTALLLVSAGAVGGIVLQPLVGRLADRFDRNLVLAALVTGALLATLLMPVLTVVDGWNYAYQLFAFGMRAGIYGVALTLVGATFRGAELATASALFNLMWGLGSMFGPALGGHAMAAWQPHGVPASVAVLLLALLPLPLFAWLRQRKSQPASGT